MSYTYDVDKLQGGIATVEKNLVQLRLGLEQQKQKQKQYEELLADDDTEYDKGKLQEALIQYEDNIKNIEETIVKDEVLKAKWEKELIGAEAILKLHGVDNQGNPI